MKLCNNYKKNPPWKNLDVVYTFSSQIRCHVLLYSKQQSSKFNENNSHIQQGYKGHRQMTDGIGDLTNKDKIV